MLRDLKWRGLKFLYFFPRPYILALQGTLIVDQECWQIEYLHDFQIWKEFMENVSPSSRLVYPTWLLKLTYKVHRVLILDKHIKLHLKLSYLEIIHKHCKIPNINKHHDICLSTTMDVTQAIGQICICSNAYYLASLESHSKR